MRITPQWLLQRWRRNAAIAALLFGGLSLLVQGLAGNFDTSQAPTYFRSEGAFFGMVILLILIPAYIAFYFVYSMRKSDELAALADQYHNTALRPKVLQIPLPVLLAGAIGGVLYALLFNVPGNGFNFFTTNAAERATIFGQVFIWTMMGCMLVVRVHIARAFRRATQNIEVDIFETSKLRLFARVGLIDVLMMAGGLLLSTVQSLDFSFDPDNYSNALVILLPAALYLTIYPMWDLHRALVTKKYAELATLDTLIAKASKNLDDKAINELERLLQRRERVRNAATWPIDVAFLQRFLFYIIIPPLAWVGAALVEFVIDGLIQG